MNRIPEEIASQFSTPEGRKKIIKFYGVAPNMYVGKNEIGEDVTLAVSPSGIKLETYQRNGWVRLNYYNTDGNSSGETYGGRWKTRKQNYER